MFHFIFFFITLLCSARSTEYFSENDIPEFNYLNTSINPCDNFYEFACGNFKKFHPLPLDLNIIDHFVLLEDELTKIGQEILSSPKLDEDPVAVKKAKAAYKACINVQLDNDEFTPELRTVKEFGGMPLLSSSPNPIDFSWNDIGELVAKYGVPLILQISVGQLSQNESAILISADPLANPSSFRPRFIKTYDEIIEESFQEAAKDRITRSAEPAPFDIFLQTLARNLLKSTNPTKPEDEVTAELNDMATFMRQLYAGGILEQDVVPLEMQITLRQLQEWTEIQFSGELQINWSEYLNRVFQMSGITITDNTTILQQSAQWLYGVLNLVRQTDPQIVKNFALLRVFLFQAPDSDYPTRKAFNDYYTAKGYPLYPRREYCARKVLDIVDTASLSYAVTYAFERYHFNINKLSQAAEVVQNIQNSFKNILIDSTWMEDQSQSAALEKAKNMLILLGFPDFVDSKNSLDDFYKNFRICEWDNYGNAKTIRAFKQAYQFTQLETNRFFWGKSTFDTNAYYNRPNNKMVIPISMLNPVFFYGDNPILDYSRLGSIIGHEITHGFDNNGKNYDQYGLPESWWSSQTMQQFVEKATCFINQYSHYFVPEVNAYINGSYSINENLADNGGVRESYKAFRKIVQEKEIEASGLYSLDQLFFIGYATMWCSEETDYAFKVLISTTDGYPPNRYRVIGSLSNMEEFSAAFNCPIGSNMNPEKKCLLW